jgi:hypothetical protein
MRIIRTFTINDILATAEITLYNARKYIQRLERTGYITRIQDHVSGRAGSRNVYRLVRNSGPQAPVPYLDGKIYDPNLDQEFGGGDEQNKGLA